LIEVEGEVGKLRGLRFVLDTGATHSVIDRKLAARFPHSTGAKSVFSFDHLVSVEWVLLPDIHLGPLEAHNISVMVTDLNKRSDLVSGADAIIGLDLLASLDKLGIFYDSKLVVFKPRVGDAALAPEIKTPGCFTVQATIQGQPVLLLFDTGMQGIVLYEDRLRKHIPGLNLANERNGARMGPLQGKTARLPGFRLTTRELEPEVFLISGPKQNFLPGIDGYLGTDPLKAKRIEFDFEANTLRWQ
jgi:predicted aspartyl protease